MKASIYKKMFKKICAKCQVLFSIYRIMQNQYIFIRLKHEQYCNVENKAISSPICDQMIIL